MAFRGKPSWETPPSGMKKSSVFSGVRTIHPSDLARERATHETLQKEQQPTHILGIAQLKKFLELRGHDKACKSVVEGIVSCNPWAFEPVLLEELIKARNEHTDPETMNQLRDLVRSGSWMTYQRTSKQDALKAFQSVAETESRHWGERIRHADPETSREYSSYLEEAKKEFELVEDVVQNNTLGVRADEAARIVEDLQLRAYSELKKIMHANGCTIDDARKLPSGKIFSQEIERLRAIRDRLYFQCAHPDWAKRSEQTK